MPKKPKPRLSKESAEIAWWRWGGHCAVPDCTEEATAWHHIHSQAKHPDLADDPDNIIPLCERCHSRHHTAIKRIPRTCCRYAEKLAVDEPMKAEMERLYGRA